MQMYMQRRNRHWRLLKCIITLLHNLFLIIMSVCNLIYFFLIKILKKLNGSI